ncbi:MAG: hypothetical protein Q8873_06210 [Bacillota bacterium]|nr:hypothetical protein [Bacillota bacterium]
MKKLISLLLLVFLFSGLCVFAAPTPIYKEGVRDEVLIFSYSEFNNAFTGGTLGKVRFSILPESFQGTLRLRSKKIGELQEISADDIKKITFTPARDFIGSVVFLWNGAAIGQGFSDSASTVTIFVANKSVVSKLPSTKAPSFVGEGLKEFNALFEKLKSTAEKSKSLLNKKRQYAPTPTIPYDKGFAK